MRHLALSGALAVLVAAPAAAAEGKPFLSLYNTDFIVLLGFLIFVGILVRFKVPALLLGQLDKRADTIRSELAEARALREEAQSILATYERKQREVAEQAERIVAKARQEATEAAAKAKADLEVSIARRLKAAEEQIEAAQEAALRDVRERAIAVAVAAAGEVIAARISADQVAALVDGAIDEVGQRLN